MPLGEGWGERYSVMWARPAALTLTLSRRERASAQRRCRDMMTRSPLVKLSNCIASDGPGKVLSRCGVCVRVLRRTWGRHTGLPLRLPRSVGAHLRVRPRRPGAKR